MPELTVGSTVHYTDNPNHGGGHVRCFNAEVTSVYPLGYVDVRNPLTGKACGIREGKPGDLYTWHWPEPVNAVNRSVSVATVRKLRSAADALWADASTQGPALRDALQTEADAIFKRADSIEEQVKPVIEEPTAFGSILRASCEPGLRGVFWQKSPMHGKHYWESTGGALALWSELTDVEVLRVGIGESPGDAYARGYEDGVESNLPSPVDFSNINSAIREEIAKISLREGRLIGEDHSYELAKAAMKAMS
jgi:hypothetical protein